jgi:hypothetical protein
LVVITKRESIIEWLISLSTITSVAGNTHTIDENKVAKKYSVKERLVVKKTNIM